MRELLVKSGLPGGLLKWIAGGSSAAIVWKLLTMFEAQPQLITEVLKAYGPGFGTAVVLGGILIWRVDKRAGEGVSAIRGMAEAQREVSHTMQAMSASLTTLAESSGSELESIKASLGSLHGKVDELRGPR